MAPTPPPRPRILKGLLGVGAGFVALLIVYDATVTRVPRDASTKARMIAIERGVRQYFATYRALPTHLDGFVGTEASDSRIRRDAWGSSIEYRLNGTIVTLTSSGPDGAMGSGGDDIVQTFDAADPQ